MDAWTGENIANMSDDELATLANQVREEQSVISERRRMIDDEIDMRIGEDNKKLWTERYDVSIRRTAKFDPRLIAPIREFLSPAESDKLIVKKESVSVREANKLSSSTGKVGEIVRNSRIGMSRTIIIKEK